MSPKTFRSQTKLRRALAAFAQDRSGLTAVHYALIVAVVALAILPMLKSTGDGTNKELSHMASVVGGQAGGPAVPPSSSGDAGSGGGASDSAGSGPSDSADDGAAPPSEEAPADTGKKKKKKKKT